MSYPTQNFFNKNMNKMQENAEFSRYIQHFEIGLYLH
jgi:hypothetical protein